MERVLDDADIELALLLPTSLPIPDKSMSPLPHDTPLPDRDPRPISRSGGTKFSSPSPTSTFDPDEWQKRSSLLKIVKRLYNKMICVQFKL